MQKAAGVEVTEGMKYVEIVKSFNSAQSAPSCVKDCTSDATLLWRSEGVKLTKIPGLIAVWGAWVRLAAEQLHLYEQLYPYD